MAESKQKNVSDAHARSVVGPAPKTVVGADDVSDSAWSTFDLTGWEGRYVILKGASDFWGLFRSKTGLSDPDETKDVDDTSSLADDKPEPFAGDFQAHHEIVPVGNPVLYVKFQSGGSGQEFSVRR